MAERSDGMSDGGFELVPVDRDNWRVAVSLRPRPEQERFVASNAYSLAEAAYDSSCRPLLARAGGRAVGFAMYGVDPEDGRAWLMRLMVGADFQGEGNGRRILEEVLATMRRAFPGRSIRLGCEPANELAAALYRSVGFVDTGLVLDGERIMDLPADEGAGVPG